MFPREPPQGPAQFQNAQGLVYGVNVTGKGGGVTVMRGYMDLFFPLFSGVLTEVKSCFVNDMK